MPNAEKTCVSCGNPFRPKRDRGRLTCWPCEVSNKKARTVGVLSRACGTCDKPFVPPKGKLGEQYCVSCRRAADGDRPGNPFEMALPGIPKEDPGFSPPLKQAILDLETFSLDRTWGVTMVGSILIHGGGGASQMKTFDLRMCSGWPDKRSDDSELASAILAELWECDIVYAHNGLNFDIPWLNAVALKFRMPRLQVKLVDPVQIARKKYRLGRNSLSSLASFLGLEESKMPVSEDTWRGALLDNDGECWRTLRARCESDVRLLNEVAKRVVRDVGMIDYQGSAWR